MELPTLLQVFVSLVAAALAAVLAKLAATTVTYNKGDLRKMPSPPCAYLGGHLAMLLKPNFHRILSRWAEEYGPIYRFRILGLFGVVVADPVAVGQILGGHDRSYKELPKSAQTYQVLDMLWSKSRAHSIFTDLNTDMWRLVRKAVSPAFSSANIRSKFPLVKEKAVALAKALKANGTQDAVDIDDAGMRLTLDVVGLAGFGHDFGAVTLGHNDIIANLPYALEMCQQRMTNPFARFSWNQESRKGMRHVESFRKAVADLLAELKARGPPADDDHSIGALLLKIVDPNTERGLSDDQLKAEIGTMIMGGFETTAHTLAFTIFCIATNPAAEPSVVAELQGLGLLATSSQPIPRQLQHNDLKGMPYINNAIKEAMRMFPVVAGFPRVTEEECKIGEYRVPKGVLVYVLFHALHNSSSLWNAPAVYNPDRWNEDGMGLYQPGQQPVKDAVGNSIRVSTHSLSQPAGSSPYKTFLPFSDGPRSCVGQAMALMELRTAIAVLFSRFTFKLAPEMGGPQGVIDSEIMALTLHTRRGIRMFCYPRVES